MEKTAPQVANFEAIFATHIDVSRHMGNKPINSTGLERMLEFCKYVFQSEEQHVIVGGHSLWFKSFFVNFLPFQVEHVSKKKKIINGGVVAFDLMQASTPQYGDKYMIDPKSIRVVYGGF